MKAYQRPNKKSQSIKSLISQNMRADRGERGTEGTTKEERQNWRAFLKITFGSKLYGFEGVFNNGLQVGSKTFCNIPSFFSVCNFLNSLLALTKDPLLILSAVSGDRLIDPRNILDIYPSTFGYCIVAGIFLIFLIFSNIEVDVFLRCRKALCGNGVARVCRLFFAGVMSEVGIFLYV